MFRERREKDGRAMVNNGDACGTGCGVGKQHKYFATGSSELLATTADGPAADGDHPQPGWSPLHLSATAQSCATAKSS